jgi:hypothetical protein
MPSGKVPENLPEGHADRPLDLTVYSLPDPAAEGVPDSQRTASGRWKMILVMLICAAPVIASYFTYYVVRPDSRRSFGELVEPQRPLPDLAGTGLQGQAINLRALKGQWLLVSVGSGDCNEACAHNLYLQHQLRESLGKERDRVDWVWLIPDDLPVSAKLQSLTASATVLRVPAAPLQAWLQAAPGQALADHIYLVDPMGNWMMRLPPRLDLNGAAKAKRDIERVLRASASWDTPGRAP